VEEAALLLLLLLLTPAPLVAVSLELVKFRYTLLISSQNIHCDKSIAPTIVLFTILTPKLAVLFHSGHCNPSSTLGLLVSAMADQAAIRSALMASSCTVKLKVPFGRGREILLQKT
jgi:hypothetical protein